MQLREIHLCIISWNAIDNGDITTLDWNRLRSGVEDNLDMRV